MSVAQSPKDSNDYKVADMSPESIAWGRKELSIAETEMPGLMVTPREICRISAIEGRAHCRFTAYDHPDRRVD